MDNATDGNELRSLFADVTDDATTRMTDSTMTMSAEYRWILATTVIVISLLAIVGNACLFKVILDPRYKLQSNNNALILCLAGTSHNDWLVRHTLIG